ncbi:S9 family peptidase [Woodsholea maritima]|uniref:S9 family peptidase n=1 Tax=Woodsholea maritima TaxID=240237 RepID=UPI00039C679E|nr:S9 family peptidase [Woodsholea maritima]
MLRVLLLSGASLGLLSACADNTGGVEPHAFRGSAAYASETARQMAAPVDTHTGPKLDIERLYGSPSLYGATPRGLTFSPDGERITFLLPKETDRLKLDLWAMDVADGNTYQLVDSDVLAPEERALTEAEIQYRERARISNTGIVSYDWDANGDAVLVPLDGDVFYVDVETKVARRLSETEAFETDARVSPEGGWVSFIRDQNLWIYNLATGQEGPVTNEGGDLISWGVAEFVAQEEMQRYTGYWWSPDDRKIALTRVDESPVDVVERFEIGPDGVVVHDQRYPRAGKNNALVSLHVYDIRTSRMVNVDLGADTDIYVARVNWSADGSTLYVQRQNREQSRLDLLAVDPNTGRSRIVLSEDAGQWINLTNDFTPLEDGGFIWTSERTGFRHVYHYDAEGNARTLTSGEWVVGNITHVDEDSQVVYFEGWMEDPTQRHLYSVSYGPDGASTPHQITSGEGRWGVSMGEGGAFIGSYSDIRTPTQTGLYNVNGERVAWIEENALNEDHPYFPYLDRHVYPEFGTVMAADGTTELQYEIYRPEGCDGAHPCPAIVEVYGGPHAQRVTKGWQSLNDQLYVQAGYVYFRLDNRGSWNRGHAFEAALHRDMGNVEVQDQLKGLDYLKSLDFVDGERVGLWGWSYGGYMTLMTTLQAPGAYAAAVSGAPVSDWSLYDTHYTERYMGTPENNPDGYARSDVMTHIENYQTPTLMIHGMSDDNVTFDHATRVYHALQGANQPFEMMTYPGQRHGIRGTERQRHLLRVISDFFARKLDGERLD